MKDILNKCQVNGDDIRPSNLMTWRQPIRMLKAVKKYTPKTFKVNKHLKETVLKIYSYKYVTQIKKISSEQLLLQ